MSSANDEKVVKPPQKPVIRKTFIDGEMTWVFSARSEENTDHETADNIDGERTPRKRRNRNDMGQFSRQKAQACADKTAESCKHHRFEHNSHVFG